VPESNRGECGEPVLGRKSQVKGLKEGRGTLLRPVTVCWTLSEAAKRCFGKETLNDLQASGEVNRSR